MATLTSGYIDGTDLVAFREFADAIGAHAKTVKPVMPSGASPGQPAATSGNGKTPALTIDWAAPALSLGSLRGLENVAARALAALASGSHVVLLGPPGTGKTELAESLARAYSPAGLVDYRVATATAEWSTFDTIGGYLPSPGASQVLEFVPGLVTESIAKGRWLIIDELNRADIDKAFGELFTVLSKKPVTLPFRNDEGKRFTIAPLGTAVVSDDEPILVSPDWRLIGTMNSFDKASLFQLSFAFMRRFAFVEVPVPEEGAFGELLDEAWPDVGQGAAGEFRKQVSKYLRAIFLPDTGALARAGSQVGPAIPLAMAKYLTRAASPQVTGGDARKHVLDALKMYLFPQMEGQEGKHEALTDALSVALGNADDKRDAEIDRSLAVWTGFERR